MRCGEAKSWKVARALMRPTSANRIGKMTAALGISELTWSQWVKRKWKGSGKQLQTLFLFLWVEAVCKDYGRGDELSPRKKIEYIAAMRMALRYEARNPDRIYLGKFKKSCSAMLVWATDNTEIEDWEAVKRIWEVFDRSKYSGI